MLPEAANLIRSPIGAATGVGGSAVVIERLWQYDQVVFDISRAAVNLRDRKEET
jgi:hypothetical protein